MIHSIIHKNTTRANKTREFKYPVVHNITREGLGFWYSNKKRSDNYLS